MIEFRPLHILLLLAACGGGGTKLVEPPPPPAAGFRVALAADPEDAASAQALGWASGLPGFDVTITPTDSSAPPRTATTTTAGIADFGSIPSGSYFLETARWLSATEEAHLSPALGIDGWATKARVSAQNSSTPLSVSVPTSRRRSLVISEWFFNKPYALGLGAYLDGGFLELYNNADSTIYLDGLIVGEGFSLSYDFSTFPCPIYNYIALDPAGIWARWWQAFPGGGHDHPLLPGHTAVIATDAIDHRALYPGTLDLSHADFEFVGTNDVDNPAVPNMLDSGVQPSVGHGIEFEDNSAVPFVALPVDTATIPRTQLPAGSKDWARIPAAKILDIVMIAPNDGAAPEPECSPLITPNFDRAPSRVRSLTNENDEAQHSVVRRVAFLLPDGRKVLQHSRTGFADFVRGGRTPGAIP